MKIKPVEYETENIGLVYGFAIMYRAWNSYFFTDQSRFGALGHGIHDVDTSVLMSIAEERYTARVSETSQKDRADLREAWRV